MLTGFETRHEYCLHLKIINESGTMLKRKSNNFLKFRHVITNTSIRHVEAFRYQGSVPY